MYYLYNNLANDTGFHYSKFEVVSSSCLIPVLAPTKFVIFFEITTEGISLLDTKQRSSAIKSPVVKSCTFSKWHTLIYNQVKTDTLTLFALLNFLL